MKKLVLAVVAMAAMNFASCGNSTKTEKSSQDSLSNDTTVVDSASADSSIAVNK